MPGCLAIRDPAEEPSDRAWGLVGSVTALHSRKLSPRRGDRRAQKEAESHGTLHAGGKPSVRDMFEGVYEQMPAHMSPAPASGMSDHAPQDDDRGDPRRHGRHDGRDQRVVVFARMSASSVAFSAARRACRRNMAKAAASTRRFRIRHRRSAAIGMAAYGLQPCVEVQFADYVYPAYDQIAGRRGCADRSAGDFTCPIVVRMLTGAAFRRLTHSQSPEALFTPRVGPEEDGGAVQPA